MENNNGFTLIEVIVSLMILSVSLIVFISLFGNTVSLISDSKTITNETFELQGKMEDKIIEYKKSFVEGTLEKDYDVLIFSGNYQSTVSVKEIKKEHSSGRKYITLVSNIEILEPKLPEVEYFTVGVYLDSDSDFINEVFPWYEDDIVIGAKFKILDDPIIFENRERWYRSVEGIKNPVYNSEYVYKDENEPDFDEVIVQEPDSNFAYKREIKRIDSSSSSPSDKKVVKSNRFYYFELRPYTLAGRVAHFRNDDRILVLNKPNNNYWKEFIEGIYPKTSSGDTIEYSIASEEIYAEVMQNSEVPTLDLNWSKNIDPQGALVGTLIPINNNEDFNIKMDFQVDDKTLQLKPDNLGLGMFLGNDSNSGYMITFDVANNSLRVDTVNSGNYDLNILTINLLEDSRFANFIKTVDGEDVFMWDKLFSINLSYVQDTQDSVNFILSYRNDDDNIVNSRIVQFDYGNTEPDYVGFKTYSSLDYIVNDDEGIFNEYERNYAAHFYDLDFNNVSSYFSGRSSLMIENFADQLNKEDIVLSNGIISDIIELGNNKNLIILKQPLSLEDVNLGITMNINDNIMTKTIIGSNQIVFDEDFENYDIGIDYPGDWNQYENGKIKVDGDIKHYGVKSLIKYDNSDPDGGYKALNQAITNFVFDGWVYRSSGNGDDRFAISNDEATGYGVAITDSKLRLEKRNSGIASNFIPDMSTNYSRTSNEWYRVVFIKDGTNLIARVYDKDGNFEKEVKTTDDTYNSFTRFYIHGDSGFNLDDLSIGTFK